MSRADFAVVAKLARALMVALALAPALALSAIIAPTLRFAAFPTDATLRITQFSAVALEAVDSSGSCLGGSCAWNFTCGNLTGADVTLGANLGEVAMVYPDHGLYSCQVAVTFNNSLSPNSNIIVVDSRPFPYGTVSFSPAATYVTQFLTLTVGFHGGGSFASPGGRYTFIKRVGSGTPTAFGTTGLTTATSVVNFPSVLTLPFTVDDLVGGAATNVSIGVRVENVEGGTADHYAAVPLVLYPQPGAVLTVTPAALTVGARLVVNVANVFGNAAPLNASIVVRREADGVIVARTSAISTSSSEAVLNATFVFDAAALVNANTTGLVVTVRVTDGVGAQSSALASSSVPLAPVAVALVAGLPSESTVGAQVLATGSIFGGTAPFNLTWSWRRAADNTTVGAPLAPLVVGAARTFALNYTLTEDMLASSGSLADALSLHIELTDSVGVVSVPAVFALVANARPAGQAAFAPVLARSVGQTSNLSAVLTGGTLPLRCTFVITNASSDGDAVAPALGPIVCAARVCTVETTLASSLLDAAGGVERLLGVRALIEDSAGVSVWIAAGPASPLVLSPLAVGVTAVDRRAATVGRSLVFNATRGVIAATGAVTVALQVSLANGTLLPAAGPPVVLAAPGDYTTWTVALPDWCVPTGIDSSTLAVTVLATDSNGAVASWPLAGVLVVNARPSAVLTVTAPTTAGGLVLAGSLASALASGRRAGTGAATARWSIHDAFGVMLIDGVLNTTDSSPAGSFVLAAALIEPNTASRALRFGVLLVDADGASPLERIVTSLADALTLVPPPPPPPSPPPPLLNVSPPPPSPPPPPPPPLDATGVGSQAILRTAPKKGLQWWELALIVGLPTAALCSLLVLLVVRRRRRQNMMSPSRAPAYRVGKKAAPSREPTFTLGDGGNDEPPRAHAAREHESELQIAPLFAVGDQAAASDDDNDAVARPVGAPARLFSPARTPTMPPIKPAPPPHLNTQVLSSDAALPAKPPLPAL